MTGQDCLTMMSKMPKFGRLRHLLWTLRNSEDAEDVEDAHHLRENDKIRHFCRQGDVNWITLSLESCSQCDSL